MSLLTPGELLLQSGAGFDQIRLNMVACWATYTSSLAIDDPYWHSTGVKAHRAQAVCDDPIRSGSEGTAREAKARSLVTRDLGSMMLLIRPEAESLMGRLQ